MKPPQACEEVVDVLDAHGQSDETGGIALPGHCAPSQLEGPDGARPLGPYLRPRLYQGGSCPAWIWWLSNSLSNGIHHKGRVQLLPGQAVHGQDADHRTGKEQQEGVLPPDGSGEQWDKLDGHHS